MYKEKLSAENKILNGIEAGHSSMQGYRVNMEDQHIIDKMSTIPDHTLLAIMDGKLFFVNVVENTELIIF